MKWDQEVEEKGSHCLLSANRCLLAFVTYFDIIGVKCVEDFKILFEALADVSLDDGRI